MAEIVGAKYEHEITLMNSLTVNLHLMMQVSDDIDLSFIDSNFLTISNLINRNKTMAKIRSRIFSGILSPH